MTMSIGRAFENPEDIRTYELSESLLLRGLVGIEVELEGLSGYNFPKMKYWKIVKDGSLRDNGMEFVLKYPLSGRDAVNSLEELESNIKNFKDKTGRWPRCTERTSVHVHVDVRDLSKEQLVSFYILFTIFERSFFKVFGGDGQRLKSNYCTPTYKSNKGESINKILNGDYNDLYSLSKSSSKYSSLSLQTVTTLGTLEARLHRATWRKSELLLWIKTLLSLKKYATEHEISTDDFSASVSMEGFEQFSHRLFGGDAEILGAIIYPEVQDDLLKGIRVAQDMLISHRASNTHSLLQQELARESKKGGNRDFLKTPSRLEVFCLKNDIDYEGGL